MKSVTFQVVDGTKVELFIDHITAILDHSDHCIIYMLDSSEFEVACDRESAVSKIKAAC